MLFDLERGGNSSSAKFGRNLFVERGVVVSDATNENRLLLELQMTLMLSRDAV